MPGTQHNTVLRTHQKYLNPIDEVPHGRTLILSEKVGSRLLTVRMHYDITPPINLVSLSVLRV